MGGGEEELEATVSGAEKVRGFARAGRFDRGARWLSRAGARLEEEEKGRGMWVGPTCKGERERASGDGWAGSARVLVCLFFFILISQNKNINKYIFKYL
jgi:hypothetical protein